MSNVTRNICEFTQDDWNGYADAESWSAKQPPLSGFIGEWGFVFAKNGVEAYRHTVDGEDLPEPEIWGLSIPTMTRELAMAIFAGLPDTFDPETFGFVCLS